MTVRDFFRKTFRNIFNNMGNDEGFVFINLSMVYGLAIVAQLLLGATMPLPLLTSLIAVMVWVVLNMLDDIGAFKWLWRAVNFIKIHVRNWWIILTRMDIVSELEGWQFSIIVLLITALVYFIGCFVSVYLPVHGFVLKDLFHVIGTFGCMFTLICYDFLKRKIAPVANSLCIFASTLLFKARIRLGLVKFKDVDYWSTKSDEDTEDYLNRLGLYGDQDGSDGWDADIHASIRAQSRRNTGRRMR